MAGIVFAILCAHAGAFEVVGHRGARGLSPENTIVAFQQGAAVGATTVEADVVMTRDRHVVVHHDLRVSGYTCAGPYLNRFLKNLTLDQVRRMDCGTRQVPDGLAATQTPSPGAHIPTLGQVYRATPPAVRLLVEVKMDPYEPRATYAPAVIARHVVDTIRGADGVGRTTVQSFDWRVLREIARRAPHLRLLALANDITLFPGSRWLGGVAIRSRPFESGLPSAVQRAGFDALAVPFAKLAARLVDSAHGRGLEVLTFTVDDPQKMGAAIALGVDGIISDYPDRLLREVRRTSPPTLR